jgi:N-acetylneuraminic acid mutarotase
MPTPRTDLAVAAHGRQIYAIGGVSNDGVTARVEVYDPSTEAWEPRQSKPTPSGFVSAAVVGDKIYVPGGIGAGVQPLDVLEVYDPLEDTWETLEPMPEPLGGYGLAVLDDQIYLFGGRGTQGYVSTVYRYDPATGEWATMQPMEQAKGLLGAAALGDRIYVVGGYDDVSEFDACNIYDPSSDSWTTCPSMERPRGGLALVTVRDKLYAIGGGMTSYLAYNEVYDSKVGTWRRIATPVNEEWRGLGATLVNNFVHTIGGWSGGNLSVNEAYKAIYVVVVP